MTLREPEDVGAEVERLRAAIKAHREKWKGAGIHWKSNRELWAAIGLKAPGDGGWCCPHDLSAMDDIDETCLLCGRAREEAAS